MGIISAISHTSTKTACIGAGALTMVFSTLHATCEDISKVESEPNNTAENYYVDKYGPKNVDEDFDWS